MTTASNIALSRVLQSRLGALALLVASVLVAAPALPATAAPASVYVALGDSYSSGEGACRSVTGTGCGYLPGSNTTSDQCHRSRNAYPAREARALPAGWRFVFAACSGSATADVSTDGRYGEPAQLTALRSASRLGTVRLVTLTLGGNDAGFVTAVATCVTAYDLLGSTCGGRVRWAVPLAALRERLAAVYVAVHVAAPHARLVVLGYPRLFAAAATAACDVAPVDAKALSKAEDTLNATVASAVRRADASARKKFASFVDDGRLFAGHELCAATPAAAWLNALQLRNGVVPRAESFHPNTKGQAALASRLRSALAP